MWKKLATPFVKFWNWIKETAWIQPLLIVGVVFAIIFSISPLVTWIQGMQNDDDSMDYYDKFNYSLKGVTNDEETDTSKAGQLIQNIMTAANGSTEDERNQAINKLPQERFFITFVEDDCSNCSEAYDGFKYLQENFNKGSYISKTLGEADSLKFSLVTIDVQEERDSGDDEDETLFSVFTKTYGSFFETVGGDMQDTDYYTAGNISSSTLDTFTEASVQESFPTPTILLVDFTRQGSANGVREIMFSVAGKDNKTGSGAKALTLMDCWNHTGDFTLDKND